MLQISMTGLSKLFKALVGCFLILLFLNCAGLAFGFITGHHSLFGLIYLVDFNSQGGLPFYFSSFCLLLAACLLYYIYRSHKVRQLSDSKYWLVLAIGFLFLSIDEYVGFHRMLTTPLRSYFQIGRLFYFAWVIPGIIICLILVMYFFKFYWHLPLKPRILIGLSAILVIGGAIGLEIIDGFYAPEDGSANLTYSILYTIEQTMEWGGILVFLYALLNYIGNEPQAFPSLESRRNYHANPAKQFAGWGIQGRAPRMGSINKAAGSSWLSFNFRLHKK